MFMSGPFRAAEGPGAAGAQHAGGPVAVVVRHLAQGAASD